MQEFWFTLFSRPPILLLLFSGIQDITLPLLQFWGPAIVLVSLTTHQRRG